MDAKLSALLLLLFNSLCYYNRRCVSSHRDVAQLGRALRSGRRGRRFKSCRFDFRKKHRIMSDVSFLFSYVCKKNGEQMRHVLSALRFSLFRSKAGIFLFSSTDTHQRTAGRSSGPLHGFRSRYPHGRKEFRDPLRYKHFH